MKSVWKVNQRVWEKEKQGKREIGMGQTAKGGAEKSKMWERARGKVGGEVGMQD